MIVGTRLKNGKIAHFDVPTEKVADAQNIVRGEMCILEEYTDKTPLLALVPNCGRDVGDPGLKKAFNLMTAVMETLEGSKPIVLGKDPLFGAVKRLEEPGLDGLV